MLQEPLDLRYPGGKGLAGLYQWIVSQLPAHVFYAAPFAGKDAVFIEKSPALRSFLIDKNPDVVKWWDRQIAWPDRKRRRLRTPAAALVMPSDDGHRPRSAITVRQGCGIRFVELVAHYKIRDLLIYLDPPYLPETRVKLQLYGAHEMSYDDHVRLLRGALRCIGPVVVSGYESPLYASMLKGWKCSKRRVITRGGTPAIECLWSNAAASRASSAVSMQYSELGDSFRMRQQVDRKRVRWSQNFRGCSPTERRAILLELLKAERELTRRPHRRK